MVVKQSSIITNSKNPTVETFSKISSYLGLAAVLINIYVQDVESTNNDTPSRDPLLKIPTEDLTLFSIILIGIASLIEYGLANFELDQVNKDNGKKHPVQKKAAVNLVISRTLTIAAVIFLIISELQARSVEEEEPFSGPAFAGAINAY